MAVASPRQPVYYYECSGGRFRLVYFIPVNELERLRAGDEIAADALRDFPDGVDLDCTRPDFDEFERIYGFRPDNDPKALRRAFFALFSSTRDWERFRGSGFVPAIDLESRIEDVDETLSNHDVPPADLEPVPPPTVTLELAARRAETIRKAVLQTRMREVLAEMPVQGVDPDRDLKQQSFSKIEWGGGRPAEEAFTRLHQKQES